MGQASTSSTIPSEPTDARARVERCLKHAASGLVFLMIGFGAVGLLGVRTGTASATGGGHFIEVLHTEIARAGLAAPFVVTVSTVDGADLPGEVTIRLTSSYLESFDFQGLEPTPARTFGSDGFTWWSFDVPPGEKELEIRLDVRLEPAVQWARSGIVTVEMEGTPPLAVNFVTFVMP